MVTDERCTKALTYLAETDQLAAELKTDVARKEYAADLARKRVFLTADGNNEERKAIAEVSVDVQTAEDEFAKATLAYERVRAKRTTEAYIIEVWRSVNANRRQGSFQ
jgi:hypothetical protein